MLDLITGESLGKITYALAALVGFVAAFAGFALFRGMLPKDQGRKFAHNGALSEGKPRGAGIILICAFTLSSILLVKLDLELICYIVLIFASMITGYLDDAAEKPWGELKKGLLDLVISVAGAFAFYHFNSCEISLATLGVHFTLPPWLFVTLAAFLIWGSINVTNCSDGVDGLCATVSAISLFTALLLIHKNNYDKPFEQLLVIMLATLGAYLWFNCSPSKILMGDAGSRAIGVVLAFAFLKTGSPVMFIPCAVILIIDGGLGLLKLSCIRFLKIKGFMKNIRTPIHDHLRKNKGWSDTQTVIRLAILQAVACSLFASVAIK